MNSETKKTTFLYQLKLFGFKKFFMSFDFIVAAIVLVVMFVDRHLGLDILTKGSSNYVIAIFAAASTLFAITLASLAIILSFSSNEFMSFLRKNNKLSPLLFLFWIGNATYLVVLVLSTTYFVINSEKLMFVKDFLYPFIIAVFVYGIINTFYLLGAVIRFGFFLDIYEKYKNSEN